MLPGATVCKSFQLLHHFQQSITIPRRLLSITVPTIWVKFMYTDGINDYYLPILIIVVFSLSFPRPYVDITGFRTQDTYFTGRGLRAFNGRSSLMGCGSLRCNAESYCPTHLAKQGE